MGRRVESIKAELKKMYNSPAMQGTLKSIKDVTDNIEKETIKFEHLEAEDNLSDILPGQNQRTKKKKKVSGWGVFG